MIQENQVIVMDIDGTLCASKREGQHYLDVLPHEPVLNKLKQYKEDGWYIILFTSRQMRTHQGNVGKINATTAKTLFEWLEKHDVPYDELHLGKPWCGHDGFYVDDRAIRPSEFASLSLQEIRALLEGEKK